MPSGLSGKSYNRRTNVMKGCWFWASCKCLNFFLDISGKSQAVETESMNP